VISNLYEVGDFSFAWNVNTIGENCSTLACPTGDIGAPTYATNDVQVNYFTPWDGKVTVGARNVGDKLPPIGLGNTTNRDYDFNLYDGYGRVVYARYTQTF
jgi:iron complex outermembrane receptor protein